MTTNLIDNKSENDVLIRIQKQIHNWCKNHTEKPDRLYIGVRLYQELRNRIYLQQIFRPETALEIYEIFGCKVYTVNDDDNHLEVYTVNDDNHLEVAMTTESLG